MYDDTMKQLLLLFTFLSLSLHVSANDIYTNGIIYTQNNHLDIYEAMVVNGSKIIYVGDTNKALTYANEDSNITDLKQKFVMPGIIDSHAHYAIASVLFSQGVNLIQAKGKKEIITLLKQYKQENPNQKMVTGFGFYPYAFGPNGPTKEILDDIFPSSNVFIISNNGHSAWANSKMLKFLHVNKNTPDPKEGFAYYQRDKEGNPTGFIVEGDAFWPSYAKTGVATAKTFYQSLKYFLPQLSSYGITSIFDAGTPSLEEPLLQGLHQLEKEKSLPLRFFVSNLILNSKEAINSIQRLSYLQQTYNSNLIKTQSLKYSNDNSDAEDIALLFREQELTTYLLLAAKNHADVMIHASHDLSAHEAIQSILHVKATYPQSQSRFTLAHVNMLRDSDFNKMAKANIIANIQPFDAQGDGYYEYRYLLFEEFEHKLARYKTFFEHNITTTASSDFPACSKELSKCTPFDVMEVALTRQKIGSPKNAPILDSPAERLTMYEILKAYTINGAYQLHQEDTIGSLEVGKEADFIVLDKNLLRINPKEIHSTNVLMTFVQGKKVYP